MRLLGPSFAVVTAVAAAPVAATALALRPEWRTGLRERLGRAVGPPGCIWVHAASVGEILAARGLIDGLRAAGHAVVASTQTPTARAVMRAARPDLPCRMAPLDHPWCVERTLASSRPLALVWVESELWPCWIAAARRRRIPGILLSGRISDRSYARCRRVRPLVTRTLGRLSAVGARSAEAAARFARLGVSPEVLSVTGDLKFDGDPQPPTLSPDLAQAFAATPLFVAGSTHAGEEGAALAALHALEAAGIPAALVLAPRQLARAGEVAASVRSEGRALRRRSALGPGPLRPGEVLLLDSLGELAAVFARADAAFVGGSLVPVGGHNVLEPVFGGTPVLYGPYTESAADAVAAVEAVGAGQRVADAAGLCRAVCALLADRSAARSKGARGREALAAHRGSCRASLALVERVLAARAAEARV